MSEGSLSTSDFLAKVTIFFIETRACGNNTAFGSDLIIIG